MRVGVRCGLTYDRARQHPRPTSHAGWADYGLGRGLTFGAARLVLLAADLHAGSAGAVSWLLFGVAFGSSRRVAGRGHGTRRHGVSGPVFAGATTALDSELSPASLWMSSACGALGLMSPWRRATTGINAVTLVGTAAVASNVLAESSWQSS